MATNDITTRESLLTAARMTHNNEIIDVAEVLNETNDVVMDAIVQRANDMTTHTVTRRTRLPAVSWVKVGNGWNATVGLTNQAVEQMGMLKARYLCPEDVMRLQPNPEKYRSNQERAYIESMGQELANTLMGNVASGALSPLTVPPEEFAGFQYRLSVQWAPNKVYLIHPRNTDGGGLKKKDEGRVYTSGDNAVASTSAANPNPTNSLWAYITEFSWDVGLAVEDGRAIKRLCNIDSVSTETNTLNEDYIIQIRNNFKGNDTIYMYCNETVFTQLQILAKDKTNVHWTENNPFGKPQMYFLDMPVRRCDAITNTEATL
jgi:hypothetical protein